METQSLPARLQELENELRAIKSAIIYLKSHQEVIPKDKIEYILYSFVQQEDLTWEEYKEKIIKTFVSDVYLYDDRMIVNYNICRNKESLDSSIVDLLSSPKGKVFDERITTSMKKSLSFDKGFFILALLRRQHL